MPDDVFVLQIMCELPGEEKADVTLQIKNGKLVFEHGKGALEDLQKDEEVKELTIPVGENWVLTLEESF